MIKVDAHTHSEKSPKGGLKFEDYKDLLLSGTLDVIAITDFADISYAQSVFGQLGEQIIVGQTVNSKDGHVIGLFLDGKIEDNQDFESTARAIHEQDGVVVVPYPLNRFRGGVGSRILAKHGSLIDCAEQYNSRSLRNRPGKIERWARHNNVITLSVSGGHTKAELGKWYMQAPTLPLNRYSFTDLMREAKLVYQPPWIDNIIDPTHSRHLKQ